MADVQFYKVVASLPGTPAANTVYLVRVGAGFDIYVTDVTGVAVPLNAATGARVHVGTTAPSDTTMLWVQT